MIAGFWQSKIRPHPVSAAGLHQAVEMFRKIRQGTFLHIPARGIRKIIICALDNSANQNYIVCTPGPHEGRFAIVTERWPGLQWALRRQVWSSMPDETQAAYGEVVWSWRRDRGVYFAGGIPQTTVTINAAHRGEHEANRKTIARGKPV